MKELCSDNSTARPITGFVFSYILASKTGFCEFCFLGLIYDLKPVILVNSASARVCAPVAPFSSFLNSFSILLFVQQQMIPTSKIKTTEKIMTIIALNWPSVQSWVYIA